MLNITYFCEYVPWKSWISSGWDKEAWRWRPRRRGHGHMFQLTLPGTHTHTQTHTQTGELPLIRGIFKYVSFNGPPQGCLVYHYVSEASTPTVFSSGQAGEKLQLSKKRVAGVGVFTHATWRDCRVHQLKRDKLAHEANMELDRNHMKHTI